MKWISVKDRLPENSRVLVFSPCFIGSDETMIIRLLDSDFVAKCSDVTHWMPLPEPPKE